MNDRGASVGFEPPSAGCRPHGRAAVYLLAVGLACLAVALAIAGGLAAVLVQGAAGAGADDCMGAAVLPLAALAGAAVLGGCGLVSATAAGLLLWRATAEA